LADLDTASKRRAGTTSLITPIPLDPGGGGIGEQTRRVSTGIYWIIFTQRAIWNFIANTIHFNFNANTEAFNFTASMNVFDFTANVAMFDFLARERAFNFTGKAGS